MSKKIIIITVVVLFIIVGVLFLLGRAEKPAIDESVSNKEKAREIAGDWIINNSPTYVFDGFNLELIFEEELIEEILYSFIFSFESRAAGYGNRTDEITAQVITPHIIEVMVGEEEVVSAVTDDIYDEITGRIIEEVSPEIMEIDVYFVKIVEGQEEIMAVERTVPFALDIWSAAVEELLKGPLPDEEAEGFSTAINQGTKLQNIDIQNSVAFVDFNEKLEEGVAGSARVMAIRGQIEKTLLQFDFVDEVIISINGRTEDILQP